MFIRTHFEDATEPLSYSSAAYHDSWVFAPNKVKVIYIHCSIIIVWTSWPKAWASGIAKCEGSNGLGLTAALSYLTCFEGESVRTGNAVRDRWEKQREIKQVGKCCYEQLLLNQTTYCWNFHHFQVHYPNIEKEKKVEKMYLIFKVITGICWNHLAFCKI